jgi:NAD(P)-dependent dehydrogenase (short-subunit alcohol dehydrogenase family)
LDVTDEGSMRDAVDAVVESEGAVRCLVNNAGYSQSGALETLPMQRLRAQFETNVFGLVRMCQLVLPAMRRQRWGRIVNLSSMGGRLSFPGGGAYHATKHAVEALSDVLRFEVGGFGVDVVVIEPGLITTRFAEVAAGSIGEATETPADTEADPYASFNARRRFGQPRRLRRSAGAARRTAGVGRQDDRARARGPAAADPLQGSPPRRGSRSPSASLETAPGTRLWPLSSGDRAHRGKR